MPDSVFANFSEPLMEGNFQIIFMLLFLMHPFFPNLNFMMAMFADLLGHCSQPIKGQSVLNFFEINMHNTKKPMYLLVVQASKTVKKAIFSYFSKLTSKGMQRCAIMLITHETDQNLPKTFDRKYLCLTKVHMPKRNHRRLAQPFSYMQQCAKYSYPGISSPTTMLKCWEDISWIPLRAKLIYWKSLIFK